MTQSELACQLFFVAQQDFSDACAQLDMEPAKRTAILDQVDRTRLFSQWTATFEKLDPLRKTIENETRDVLRRTDEIITVARSAMARSVIVFRDTMIEREKLARQQARTSEERERRVLNLSSTINEFRHIVENALGKLRGASMKLKLSSNDLDEAADTVSSEADIGRRPASDHVGAAAGSVEELAASIGESAGQAAKSTEVARRRSSKRRAR